VLAHVPLVATDADVLETAARNPGWRIERDADGQLLMTPPAGGQSSRRNARLTQMLQDWADRHHFISFDSSAGFRLPDSSIVAPDGALLLASAWSSLDEEQREGFVQLVPAVAIELRSRSDEPLDLQRKLEKMRSYGTAYVVLVDPYEKSIWTDGQAPEGFDVDFGRLMD
jgi:Uma2 family endonuclease